MAQVMLLTRILSLLAATAVPVSFSGAAEPDGPPGAPASISTSGGVCKAGFDTSNDTAYVDGTNYTIAPPVSVVAMKKPCSGAVVARLTAFVSAPYDDQLVQGGVQAKCVGDGGYADGCQKGEVVWGSPDYYYIAVGPGAVGTYSMLIVFADMEPGEWRFKARVGGFGDAYLRYRSFSVKAYRGG